MGSTSLVVPAHPPAELETGLHEVLMTVLTPHDVAPDAVSVTLVETIVQERGDTDKRRRVIRM